MNRAEVREFFRTECPEIPTRVVSDALLNKWLLVGDKDVAARTRCIVDDDGTTITTSEDDERFDLMSEITNFFDIDNWPGGGVVYNGKRLIQTTIAELDQMSPSWRSNSSGTPTKYYRRGKNIFLNRPIDSEADDLIIYAVLVSDDFNSDSKLPFNELTYLTPFHFSLVKWLIWKAKAKVGKPQDAQKAQAEYLEYTLWMKKEITGGKTAPIYFRKKI